MANLFQSLIGKLGLSKSTVVDQAENILNQNRDKIPDQIEGQIDSALHGDMVEGLLDKIGLGGDDAPATDAPVAEAEATEEATTEEQAAPAEEEVTEEEATEEESTEETAEEEKK